jgi:hypothetical protein
VDAGRMAVWEINAVGEVVHAPQLNKLLGLPEDARPTLAEIQERYYPGELESITTPMTPAGSPPGVKRNSARAESQRTSSFGQRASRKTPDRHSPKSRSGTIPGSWSGSKASGKPGSTR